MKIVQSKNRIVKYIIMFAFLLLAVIRYFYILDARMAFEVDESLSLSRAVGFMNTGTFYEWDFANDCISDIPSNSHQGYTVLLAAWLKLFGVSLMSARTFSAVLGCLFVLSFVYISFQLFERWDVTVIATTYVILEPEITFLFRFIRYYSVVLLLSIWVVYFAYQAIVKSNHFKSDHKLILFINRNFDYNFVYCLLMVVSGFAVGQIHNIQLVLYGGMLLFIMYKALVGKERKYRNVSIIALFLIVIGSIGLLWSDVLAKIPVLGYFMLELKYWASFGQNNVNYYWDSVDALSNQLLMFMGWALAIVLLFSKKRGKEEKEKVLYLVFIQVVSIVFMVCFANHYYQARYLSFLLPISILIFSVGITDVFGRYLLADLLIAGLLVSNFGYILNSSYEYLYTLHTAPGSQEVYEMVNSQYPGEKNILGVDMDMSVHGYFASQFLEDYNYNQWEKYDTDESFVDVTEFAKEYPNGLVWVIENQIFNRRQMQRRFLIEFTDRIAGQGLDNYNIEVGVLNYIQPTSINNTVPNGIIGMKESVLPGKEYCVVAVDGKQIQEDAEFICIRLEVVRNGGDTELLCFQLGIPEQKELTTWEYRIELEGAEAVSLDSLYAVVTENELLAEEME